MQRGQKVIAHCRKCVCCSHWRQSGERRDQFLSLFLLFWPGVVNGATGRVFAPRPIQLGLELVHCWNCWNCWAAWTVWHTSTQTTTRRLVRVVFELSVYRVVGSNRGKIGRVGRRGCGSGFVNRFWQCCRAVCLLDDNVSQLRHVRSL